MKPDENYVQILTEKVETLKKQVRTLKEEREDFGWMFKTSRFLPQRMKQQILDFYDSLNGELSVQMFALRQELSERGYFV